jgi:S-adenosylmethionine decarboxylase
MDSFLGGTEEAKSGRGMTMTEGPGVPRPSAAPVHAIILHGANDLAPSIHRQRLVVEGTCRRAIDDDAIRSYLRRLSEVCGMRALMEPVTHRSEQYGWAGWIHWETSGAHFYAWEYPTLFFSVDVYTCKRFEPRDVISYTQAFFEPTNLVAFTF